ncbi:MAG: MazG-like family protein [bacterium]
MAKTIQEITDIIANFSKERGWTNEDPGQLISSLFIEMGELAEHYQWQSRFKPFNEEEKQIIGYEFTDVIFYLFRLASNSGIDIEKYFLEKIPKLAKKFPVGTTDEDWEKAHKTYRKSGKSKLYE